MDKKIPKLLLELKELVEETMPFLIVGDVSLENTKTNTSSDGISLEYKEDTVIPKGFVTSISLAIEDDQLIVAVHANSRPDATFTKNLDNVTANDLLRMFHSALVNPETHS